MEITDEQLRAAIMEFLLQKGRWGAHYFPIDTMINWIGRKVKKNGKRVERTVKDLVKDGYLFLHKKGGTVSLNPARSQEISEYIENNLPE
ncbi:MAG: hypothetical protein ACRD5H_10405 [Nitrososphaerales archaeon]